MRSVASCAHHVDSLHRGLSWLLRQRALDVSSFAYLMPSPGQQRSHTSRLEDQTVCRVLGAQVPLLARIPQGRLLARFAADTATIDDALPFTLNILLATAFSFAAAVLVMMVSQPLLAIVVLPVAILYHRVQRYYRCVPYCWSCWTQRAAHDAAILSFKRQNKRLYMTNIECRADVFRATHAVKRSL